MKFGDFLFPESRTPDKDFAIISDALREAELCDQLGYDALWLAEHHFDGGCAYVDPVTFASAIAARTQRIKIGFAVAQMALHHPTRFAEQIALVDNISRGRVIVGVGRGTAYNFYEFRGYGIDPQEAQERLLEVEQVLVEAWTTENYRHEGRFWQMQLPVLRPQVYQKPYPPIIRACSGLKSTLDMARQGRPFLMNK
jgi:alkanesulfonate monooxygenase SsuD/methylene tetrahydromethanopterin reductase-like flavin-dependent oxidoreductase (luciferase family)